MRAIIAVPFFDSPENGRYGATIRVLSRLTEQVKAPHIIAPVNNGSSDPRSHEWIMERGCFPHYVHILEPMSIAQGVNSGWRPFHEELMAGEAVAVKFDADMFVTPNNWLELMLAVAQENPDVGLIGPKMENFNYGDPIRGDTVKWHEVSFVHGGVCMRSPQGFRAIGYCRNPYGRWGYQDHWDTHRTQYVLMKIAILAEADTFGIFGSSALSRPEKAEILKQGMGALNELLRQLREGERNPFEVYDGI